MKIDLSKWGILKVHSDMSGEGVTELERYVHPHFSILLRRLMWREHICWVCEMEIESYVSEAQMKLEGEGETPEKAFKDMVAIYKSIMGDLKDLEKELKKEAKHGLDD